MFEEVLVYTLYNTAPLLAKLEAADCRVFFNTATQENEVQRAGDGYTAKVEHFSYFLQLVQQCFMTEEKVVELLQSFFTATAGMQQEGARVRVELHIQQALTAESPARS
jgi:hypothetical protein